MYSNAKQSALPEPGQIDREFSEKLCQKIINQITINKGSIPFVEFMNMALYESCLGYYVSGLRKFGEQGDFVTSPEISSLFGRTLVRQIKEIFDNSEINNIFELGAGTGKLAVDILTELEKLNTLPKRYIILDISAEMQQRQKQLITEKIPHLLNRVVWVTQWQNNLDAVVIANEVLDAMPVERFVIDDNKVMRQYVSYKDNAFQYNYRPADEDFSAKIKAKVKHQQQPYLSEFNPNYDGWFNALVNSINSGVLFFIDYGYPQKEYYLPERDQGTLICFYRHHSHDNVFKNIGLQDMTAFIDFTAVVESATKAGLDFEGFVAQGDFLLSNGITDVLKETSEDIDPILALNYAKQMKQLTLPGEMGERFKVIGFSKNYTPEITGFDNNDQSHQL